MTNLGTYRQAKDFGVRWLLNCINSDGSVGPVEAGFNYYRVPWAFIISGYMVEATRLCRWVKQNQFDGNGYFEGTSPREDAAYAYENATFIFGAHMLSEFELSYRGYNALLSHVDKQSGGVRHRSDGGDIAAEQNIPTAAQSGLTALLFGDLETAKAIGSWFHRIWNLQPQLPDRLYYVYSGETQSLVTGYRDADAFHYVVEAQAPEQRFTCGGIAAAFLCKLYLATNDVDALELAKQFQLFAMNSTPDQFKVPQVCKTGWGSALLYHITGEQQYHDWTIRVADYYVRSQFGDGHWENRPPAQGHHHNITITAEFVVHLDTILRSLSVQPLAE